MRLDSCEDNTAPVTVYENGRVWDTDARHAREGVIVTAGDRIRASGGTHALGELPADARRIDLAGATVYPGFIDAHAHFIDTGMMTARVDLGTAADIDDVLARISDAATGSGGVWVYGGNLDENFLRERRLPTMAELDSASGGRPLYINHRSYHWTLVNSEALRLIDLPELPGIDRDAHGRPTGLLDIDANAAAKVRVAALTPNDAVDAGIAAGADVAAQRGITGVHCIEGGEEYGGVRFVDRLLGYGPLPFEPTVYISGPDVSAAVQRGLPRLGGDITVDGSISNRTAAFEQPYADSPDSRGHLYYSPTELESMVEAAHAAGLQIGFHAIGDRGVTTVMEAYRTVLARHPDRDHRHRVEHFGLPTSADIAEARELGLTIVVQPAFMAQKLPTYVRRLGRRAERLYPLRTMVDAGLDLAGSSDSLVSPFDPLVGIESAVNGPVVEERLTVAEAIALYTTGAARAGFREQQTGALRPGMYADLVVLDNDLQRISATDITKTRVTRTVFRGATVFERTPS